MFSATLSTSAPGLFFGAVDEGPGAGMVDFFAEALAGAAAGAAGLGVGSSGAGAIRALMLDYTTRVLQKVSAKRTGSVRI